MNEITNTKQEVYRILNTNEATRNNDMILYYEYVISHWVRETDFSRVFKDAEFRKAKSISPFETVSRCRRDLQSEFVHLRSKEQVEKARREREEIFADYYGKGERV